jgi:gamma-glutamyltranspeptidase/glutathione hydrolase
MMAPTLVSHPDGWQMVVGSGGAARLRTAIMQLLCNVLDWHMPLDDAVRAARYHFQDDVLDLEAGFDPAAADALEARGYALSRWPDRAFYFGGTHVAVRDGDGRFSGVGDDRRGGAVAVVE